MSNWVEGLFKLFDIQIRYLMGIWVFGSLLIFLPDSLKTKMAITIPEITRPWVGFVTLAALVLWLIMSAIYIFSVFKINLNDRKQRKTAIEQLETLSTGERDILLSCIADNKRTIRRSIFDADTKALVSKGILKGAGGTGDATNWPFTIQKFVWDHLKKNDIALFPELLDENEMANFFERQKYRWMR